MVFSIMILFVLFAVFFFLLMINPLKNRIGKNNALVNLLSDKKWFQNHWKSGSFLFLLNAFLFFSTGLTLYGISFLNIPFIHLPLMFFAVIVSIFMWVLFNQAWHGEKRNRLKMGALGSSFFILLTFMFIYKLVTLKPNYPGEDPLMMTFGLGFGILVTLVAFVTCFIITGFSQKKINH